MSGSSTELREESHSVLSFSWKKKLLLAVEHLSSCLANSVWHSGKVEGNKAHKEDGQHQEHVCLNAVLLQRSVGNIRSLPRLVLSSCAGVRLVELFRDERVTYYHGDKVPPEDHLAHVVDHLMPLQSQLGLEVAAFNAARF